MRVISIAAMDINRVIGCNGQLPWSIPEDLQRFKRLTTGNTVLMGRKTIEGLGKPLPNRLNLVLSRSGYTMDGTVTVTSIQEAVELSQGNLYVAGGEQVYRLAFESQLVDEVDLSFIDSFHDGDSFFPSFEDDFNLVSDISTEWGAYKRYIKTCYRPSWDDYFMDLAISASSRSTCIAAKVGAVIVRDKQIVSTGYNGSLSGTHHCIDTGKCRDNLVMCTDSFDIPSRAIHAEANAIAQAAKNGVSTNHCEIYCTLEPCINCLKLILSSGIRRIIFKESRNTSQEVKSLIDESGVIWVKV